jgi:RNA polymerase sigma factor (sigma-70 family)
VDDAELLTTVLAARAGDSVAFGRLYTQLTPAVRRVVADNVHQSHDVDDVVQEVFTRAFSRLAGLREPDRFKPWLFSIARRAAIDHRRVRVAGRSVLDADPAGDLPHRDPSPDDALLVREELRALQFAAEQLSTRDATALAMVGHLGFSPSEIADALGTSVGAAKVIVHRARQRLREAIGEPDVDPA